MTLAEFKQCEIQGAYVLRGARTGKIIFQSWRNKPTNKYDNQLVASVYSDVRRSDEPFGCWLRPFITIYISGF